MSDSSLLPNPDGERLLTIVGVFSEHEGYPNVRHRLADLARSSRYRVERVHERGPDRLVAGTGGPLAKASNAFGFARAHFRLWLRLLRFRPLGLCYVPYPAVFVSALIALLPRSRRPERLVLDAFIGLHDTVVNDRGLLAETHPLARLLWRTERFAYRQADVVVVDTELNTRFMARHYQLPEALFKAVALSTDEHAFRSTPLPQRSPITVLFVGTLIPLHGVPYILEAIERLRERRDIHFEIIGDGQMRDEVERIERQCAGNLKWCRRWIDGQALSKRIERADICLGIFGDTDKAQRVCPLKLYAYLACARPVVTGRTRWTDSVLGDVGARLPPFDTVDVSRGAGALADRIASLADDPKRRVRMGRLARTFYESALSNERAERELSAVLGTGGTDPASAPIDR